MQREIWDIVIHCSAGPNGRPDTINDIDAWHRQAGWYRGEYFRIKKQFNTHLTSVGYHFVITPDGEIHTGRHLDEIPAQAAGHNSKAVAICLIGTDKFTAPQWVALKQLVTRLQSEISASDHKVVPRIIGHRDYPGVRKICPGFDVTQWLQRGMAALPDQVLKEGEK
jgi:N-acetyl-anhydromuramyl-L-alanine amidase AmpD